MKRTETFKFSSKEVDDILYHHLVNTEKMVLQEYEISYRGSRFNEDEGGGIGVKLTFTLKENVAHIRKVSK